jgi:hypothetical protein
MLVKSKKNMKSKISRKKTMKRNSQKRVGRNMRGGANLSAIVAKAQGLPPGQTTWQKFKSIVTGTQYPLNPGEERRRAQKRGEANVAKKTQIAMEKGLPPPDPWRPRHYRPDPVHSFNPKAQAAPAPSFKPRK